MPDLMNVFYYSILVPVQEGFKIFVWANEFYFTTFGILILSIPIAMLRCYPVLKDGNKKRRTVVEIALWLLRIVQYLLIIAIGNAIQAGNIFSKHEWIQAFQGLDHISLQQLMWDFVGYGILFGIYNFVIFAIIRKKWITGIVQKMYDEANVDAIYPAVMLGVKNVFLIPVSVIYLLDMLKII